MSELVHDLWLHTLALMQMLGSGQGLSATLWRFFPFVILFELPVQLLIVVGVARYALRSRGSSKRAPRIPAVTCIVTCYREGPGVAMAVRSLIEQLYPGRIDIVAVVDGAAQNRATLEAVEALGDYAGRVAGRTLRVAPKWQRGGRVSTLNAGLALARGEIVFNLDADTSFDNDMVERTVRRFDEPGVVAVAGNLRARNARASVIARMQAIEYMLSIGLGKTGLSSFNAVNNISGAFGVFRRELLEDIAGWNTGTAEDLDLTLRIKQYFGRHPGLRIAFEPHAIGHTDVPATLTGFLRQRLSWDGDLLHIYLRVHRMAFSPKLVGWTNFFTLIWSGLLWQIVLPALLFAYTAIGVFTARSTVSAVIPLVYLYYLAVTFVSFVLYVALVSERKRDDAALFPWLPLYPVFGVCARLWSFVALLRDAIFKAYLDSPMAPHWVLRMGKW